MKAALVLAAASVVVLVAGLHLWLTQDWHRTERAL